MYTLQTKHSSARRRRRHLHRKSTTRASARFASCCCVVPWVVVGALFLAVFVLALSPFLAPVIWALSCNCAKTSGVDEVPERNLCRQGCDKRNVFSARRMRRRLHRTSNRRAPPRAACDAKKTRTGKLPIILRRRRIRRAHRVVHRQSRTRMLLLMPFNFSFAVCHGAFFLQFTQF